MPNQSFRCKCGHEQDIITAHVPEGEVLSDEPCAECGEYTLKKVFTPPEGTSYRGMSTPGPKP